MEGQPPPNLGTIAAIARRYAARGRDSRPRTRPRGWTKLAALRACGLRRSGRLAKFTRSWVREITRSARGPPQRYATYLKVHYDRD